MTNPIKLLPEVEMRNIHSVAYLVFLESNLLTPEAKFIYLHLDARAGTNRYLWFGKERIYQTIGFKRDRYLKYINELELKGAIRQYKRFDNKTGSRESNIILVLEYDQINDKFIVPRNIDKIEKAIKEGNEFSANIIKENEPSILKTKKKRTKTENSDRGKTENPIPPKPKISIWGKTENTVYPHRKIRFTPIGKSDRNNRNTNNRNTNNRNSCSSKMIETFNNNIHLITPIEMQMLQTFLSDGIEEDVIIMAIEKAVENNARKISYIKSILQNWLEKGIKTKEDVDAEQRDWQDKKTKKLESNAGNFKEKPVGNFNNFEQRSYDFVNLEKQLLGWSNEDKTSG